MNEPSACYAQTYWYENGAQRAKFCDAPATHSVRSLDGSRWAACTEHAERAREAGATVTPA